MGSSIVKFSRLLAARHNWYICGIEITETYLFENNPPN